MVDRVQFINGLLGKPWVANARGPDAYDCYHLVQLVEKFLFGIDMQDIEVPNEPSWKDVMGIIAGAPEYSAWKEAPTNAPHIYHKDGATVLLATHNRPAHLGVWLKPERRVLHVDRPVGVQANTLLELQAMGWLKLRFYERA